MPTRRRRPHRSAASRRCWSCCAARPARRRTCGPARGESLSLPSAGPPALGLPAGADYGWILGQFALLGRVEVVRALVDAGMPADTRGWSHFTPLEQAAMHGRAEVVRLLLDRGADADDTFDEDSPTPLDCALWGLRNNRAEDGDYPATVEALLAAGSTTGHEGPTGSAAIDALLAVGAPAGDRAADRERGVGAEPQGGHRCRGP